MPDPTQSATSRAEDRITFNGDEDHLDEVVLTDCMLHVEALNSHTYMIAAYAGGRIVHLEAENVRVYELEGVDDLTHVGPPLLGCRAEWGRYPVRHLCERDPGHPGRHKCLCNATKAGGA